MNYIQLFILAILFIAFTSCTKQPNNSNITQAFKMGGEDDDIPIFTETVVNSRNSPVPGSIVSLFKDNDTLTNNADGIGQCRFTLPSLGSWEIKIESPGYQTLTYQLAIVDSITSKTDTLY